MGTSGFPRRDGARGGAVDTAQMALEPQQAALLEALRRADGEPVSYEKLQAAGIALPASVVSELELAGVPVERTVLGDGRSVGVRLHRSVDGLGALPRELGATSRPPTGKSPSPHEDVRSAAKHLLHEGVRRSSVVAEALLAWLVCEFAPATRWAAEGIWRTSRRAGMRATYRARGGLCEGARRGSALCVAVRAWLACEVPPTTRASVRWLARNATAGAKLARRELAHASSNAKRGAHAAAMALAREAARVPPALRAAARWLAAITHAAGERLAKMRLQREGSEEQAIVRQSLPVAPRPPRSPAGVSTGLRAANKARNRCLALGALAAVSAVVLAVTLRAI